MRINKNNNIQQCLVVGFTGQDEGAPLQSFI
jgi:hypothetical protein